MKRASVLACPFALLQLPVFGTACAYQPRQEPGRNFEGMSVPSVVEPQRQPYRAEPTLPANVARANALDIDTSVTFLVSMLLSLKPLAVTVITPSAVVVTESTYFDCTLALDVPVFDSQPQPLAPGAFEALPDW